MRTAGVIGALALALAAPAGASAASLGGLHDARYCEIIELRGALPNASATVWNTIGLNDCPAKWWNAFDAADLAKERGALAVVLNGPRHFLMDSVTASPGRTHSFHGQKLRKVATIPIRTAADIQQTPYTDRTIERTNVWRWRKGRTVYELVAPGGDVYVMQAYSQIKDRTLTLRKLRKLGSAAQPAGGLALPRPHAEAAARRGAAEGQRDDHPGRAPGHLPALQVQRSGPGHGSATA